MANNFSNWPEQFKKLGAVQPADMARGQSGGYLSSESAIITVGPAKFSGNFTELVPVGMVQSFQIQQSRAGQQIFEIGGRLPFNVPGRNTIQGSISRVLFDGPSLNYALYTQKVVDGKYLVPEQGAFGDVSNIADLKGFAPHNEPTLPYPATAGETASDDTNTAYKLIAATTGGTAEDSPGKLWLNLASALFNKPFGMGLALYDMQGDPYGAIYLEDCLIRNHNFGIQANQTVLAENISFTASRIKPVSVANFVTA